MKMQTFQVEKQIMDMQPKPVPEKIKQPIILAIIAAPDVLPIRLIKDLFKNLLYYLTFCIKLVISLYRLFPGLRNCVIIGMCFLRSKI